MVLYNKVLLIDDENICNFVTSKIIEKEGIAHLVESFLNAKPALSKIQNDLIDGDQLNNLILLDINMPIMNGWEFLEEFERLPESIRARYTVMLLTSSIDSRDVEKSKSYKSVKKFISKPFSIEKIQSENTTPTDL
jgi:CheY-like chemotaxis protein